ncbi:MAG: hypothetical protein HQ542_00760 [Bacteroidia bacterium]|nr:hypothetical protein [Bacteroidia bacterium]
MKNRIFLFIGLFLLTCSYTTYGNERSSKKTASGNNPQMESVIQIQSTPDLFKITEMWAKEYGKLNPGVNIEVIQLSQAQQKTGLEGGGVTFVSREDIEAFEDNDLWKVIVGSDAIVPVINSKNPFLNKINKQGVSPEELARLFKHPEKQTWGMLLDNGQDAPVHYYRINNDAIQSQAAYFLKSDPSVMTGINVANAEEMISAIQQDPYGIAFCRLMDVVDQGNQHLVKQITILPIDKNRNGSLDQFENIYGDLNEFTRGVWIGKYPRTLSRTIYSVSPEKPVNKAELAFLTWVVTEGQQFLNPAGNNNLAYSDRLAKRVDMLASSPTGMGVLNSTGFFANNLHGLSLFSLIVIALIPFILIFMIREAVVRHKRQKRVAVLDAKSIAPEVFDTSSVEVPNGLYFDKSHTWAFMEKTGIVRVGIDDFLQHITGPLTRIKMKSPGEKVKMGEKVLSIIQNGKQLTIHAPISGIIKAQNKMLISDTSIMNASPYTDGWVYMIEPTNWVREVRFLFMGEKYREWLKKEFSRLKDFLAVSLNGSNVEYAHVILQDGGEVKDGILEDLGPEVWEDFQTKFIDTSK